MIYRLLFLVCSFLTINTTSFGQFYKQSQADSLKAVLPQQKGKERIHTLLQLSDCYYYIQIDTSLKYANIAKNEAKKLGYEWGKHKSNFHIIKVECETKSLNEKLQKLQKENSWFKKNNFFIDAVRCGLLRSSYLYQVNPIEKAVVHSHKVLQEAKKIGEPSLLGEAWYRYHYVQAMQLNGKRFQASLDSALFYYQMAQDSLGLIKVQRRRNLYNHSYQVISFSHKMLNLSREWNNFRLESQLLSSLTLNYGSIGKSDSCYSFHEKSLVSIKKYGSKDIEAMAYLRMAYCNYRYFEFYPEAIKLALKSNKITEGLGHLYNSYSSLNILSKTYRRKKEYESAVLYSLQAHKIAKQLKHPYYINATLSSLANTYAITKKLKKAEQLYLETIRFGEEELEGRVKQKLFAATYVQLSHIYNTQGMHEKALIFLEKAFNTSLSFDYLDAILSATLKMKIYLDIHQTKNGEKMYLKIKKLFEKVKKPYSADFQFQIGRLYFTKQLYSPSIAAVKKFLENSLQKEFSEDRKQAYRLLYKAYANLGNSKLALKNHITFKTISDSIKNANSMENVALIQSQYDLSEKERELDKSKKQREIQQLTLANKDAKIAQQNQTFLLLILTILLVIIFGIFLFNRYKLRQENASLLMQTKQLELEQLQESTSKQLEMAKLRSDFYTNVSHEFRTPLTLILGPLEDLLKQENMEHKTVVEGIHHNANHLLSLVNETLDLSKVENGHLPLTPITLNIGGFVAKVVNSFNALSEIQKVSLDIVDNSMGIDVDFDEEKLKKILVNLLGNAFKYTPELGKIILTLDQPKEDYIAIHIQDTGAGIDADSLPHIFQRFYQADDKVKGTGVGLALSKQLAELHGGTLTVESELNKGSTFSITLPLKQEGTIILEKTEHHPTFSEEISLNKNEKEEQKTILIIEDHVGVRSYIQNIMQEHYRVLLAKDGNEGIELAEQHFPDLIISDIMMPHKDGLELTQHLKQHFPTSHIPIVLLTAKAALDNKIEGLKVGADDYLSKPFNSDELLQRCKNLMEQRDQLRSLFTSSHFISPNKITKTTVDREFIEKAVHLIENQLDNTNLSVDSYCKQLALNRTSVHHKLKALTGKNTSQFIKSIRLKKAAGFLMNTELDVIQVIDKVGFGSRETFNKAFREQFEMTPTEFRKNEGYTPLS